MNLSKHQAGVPLSPAEIQQRRAAARARWALGGAAGAVAGAVGGFVHEAWHAPRRMADALHEADQAVLSAAEQRRATITDLITRRLRAAPDPGVPHVPVVGTPRDHPSPLVYDYQVAGLQQRLKRTSDPAETRALRRQISGLNRLAGKAPKLTAREDTIRFPNRAAAEQHLKLLDLQSAAADEKGDLATYFRIENIKDEIKEQIETALNESRPVRAHEMRAWRGGETNSQVSARIAGVKRELRARQKSLLATLERRTTQLRETTRQLTINRMEGVLHRRMAAGAGRGVLIGAGLGLTAAGISLLARHVIDTRAAKRELAKATPENPQTSLGKGMAETYRAWIDRLLGRSDGPMTIGDDVAKALAPGLTEAFAAGATQPPVAGPDGTPQYHVDVDFDVLNPSVRRHMAEYALDRIVDISAQQRDAIRGVLMQQSVLQGIGPRDVARSLREHIGLTPYQMAIVEGYRVELETLDPAALERKLRDARYDRTIRKAIETGTPLKPEQIDAMVAAYHRRMLALRAETIARTEAIRATSYGAVARAQDVLDQHPDLDVVKRWIATEDERTRDTHRDLDGKEVLGMETPFKTSAGNLIKWPVDQDAVADECINCRCAIGYRFIPKAGAAS